MSKIVKGHICGNFKTPKVRSPMHRRFVKSFSCRIKQGVMYCSQKPIDPHHLMLIGGHGAGLTESDEWIVPLCRSHHNEVTDHGDERIFWNHYGYDYSKVIKMAKDFSKRSPCHKIRQAVDRAIERQKRIEGMI